MTEERTKRPVETALAYAFAASFLVYLQPLLFPHVMTVWGFALWADIAGFSGREPLWFAANIGLAILVQLAMGAFFYWVFRGRALLRVLGLIAVFPASTVALLYLYMMVIPAHFLIEPETRTESGDWPVACTTEDASLSSVKSGVTLALERAGEAWIRRKAGRDTAILRMPGCGVTDSISVDRAIRGSLQHALPGGIGLYRVLERSTGLYRLVRRSPDGETRLDLDLTTDERFSTILSPDGGTLVWLKRLRGERGGARGYEIHSRNLATRKQTAFHVPLARSASIQLLSADPATDRYILVRNSKDVFGIDRTGATIWGPVPSPGFYISRNNWRMTGNGWIAWEAYRDHRERYHIHWSLPAGKGTHEIPKGRSIKDVSVSPSGDLIAVSVGGSLSIGNVKDAVYILRASDGAEVFRRFLRPYTRTRVAFLGDGFFAYTKYKTVDRRVLGRVIVLRRPDAVGN